ncbi:hypothetical protein AcV5_004468 [Taiwanofungus camphoratus]|nr:hypothetical protein AcW2_000938 [Antrodia cinnamomea]KAI0936293.1 hypothetical protein AcV5_004468 [Antrodia cinnamomea]
MLITKTYHDVSSALDPNGRPIRIFVISPSVPGYPDARFPGVVCFSEIYQVTGPVERFAGQIASQGYVVACPSTYHEFEGHDPIPYDTAGTDRGNKYKIQKELAAYDEDATLSIDLLCSLKNCNGRIAATGMCLGGHLAFRVCLSNSPRSYSCLEYGRRLRLTHASSPPSVFSPRTFIPLVLERERMMIHLSAFVTAI